MTIVNPDLAVTFYCKANNYAGVISLVDSVAITGHATPASITSNTTIQLSMALSGTTITATYPDCVTQILLECALTGEAVVGAQKSNWVKWSKIGQVGFDLDLTNDAGSRPMSWPGYVFCIKPLGKSAVVYGSNGVTVMYPVGDPFPTFGFKDLNGVGVKSKSAVCGTDSVHYYIDRTGQLWQLTEKGVTLLDYSEYLDSLTNPVMFYDEYDSRVVISDAGIGYVVTPEGMGGGYGNLTGYTRIDGIVCTTTPGVIKHRPLEMATDIIDFGRRGLKSIESIQVATDTSEELYIAYDYKYTKSEVFRSTPWTRLNEEGVGHLKITGLEFRIKLKTLVVHEFDIDYMIIQFKYSDRRFVRGPIGGGVE